MFVHSVYFWLRDDLTAAQRKQFGNELEALRGIDCVHAGYIGVPAKTARPVIERGYSRALILVFADEAAHDAYQVHPVHDRFRADCGSFWSAIRIFDSVGDGVTDRS
jgi:hypothetical protein